MPFEGHIYVMYEDDQALSQEKLAGATVTLRPAYTNLGGQLKTLPEIVVPAKGEYLQKPGNSNKKQFGNEFNQWMERQAEDAEFGQFRKTGVYQFRVSFTEYHISK